MQIAFYAPLKSPNHPTPSGDRMMSQLLIKALERCGHTIQIASELRSYELGPEPEHYAATKLAAESEIARLTRLWVRDGKPDLWFCYHPYYKAPDLIGPGLASAFSLPYVTAEASYSARRNIGLWAETQSLVADAVNQAALNICFTQRDRHGLSLVAPGTTLAMLPPFIDTSPFMDRPLALASRPSRLVTVAMMRPGDKFKSYRMLARALDLIGHVPWTLSIVGDGPGRDEVMGEFVGLPPERVEWHGQVQPAAIPGILSSGWIYVWPGCGEAYGLAYLEAQAAALPVVAQNIAGVPEVVRDGQTGLLTPPGDVPALASAIERLLTHDDERTRMAEAARQFVLDERSLDAAAARLAEILPKVPAS